VHLRRHGDVYRFFRFFFFHYARRNCSGGFISSWGGLPDRGVLQLGGYAAVQLARLSQTAVFQGWRGMRGKERLERAAEAKFNLIKGRCVMVGVQQKKHCLFVPTVALWVIRGVRFFRQRRRMCRIKETVYLLLLHLFSSLF